MRIGLQHRRKFDSITLRQEERHQKLIVTVIPLWDDDLFFSFELNLSVNRTEYQMLIKFGWLAHLLILSPPSAGWPI
jgi:hypothetical protein